MRGLVGLSLLVACGGGKPSVEAPKPAPVVTASPCVAAYTEYETRWRIARGGELAELDFDPAATEDVISVEVAVLPTRSELAK